ncbi:MAG: carboxypeptidase-like regulatory domain-containing protein [Planctomycetota bacterium]
MSYPIGPSATGRLLDGMGAPLAQIEVVLSKRGEPQREVATWTNADGRYTFSGLEFGEYQIELTKGAYEPNAPRQFLVQEPVLPSFLVDAVSPAVVQLVDSKLSPGGERYHLYFHPPRDAVISTVYASGWPTDKKGRRAQFKVDRYGIAEWHPNPQDGYSSEYRVRVNFQRSTKRESFKTKVQLEVGKTERTLVP